MMKIGKRVGDQLLRDTFACAMTLKERKVVCSITEREGRNGISVPILFGMLMSKLKCRGLERLWLPIQKWPHLFVDTPQFFPFFFFFLFLSYAKELELSRGVKLENTKDDFFF